MSSSDLIRTFYNLGIKRGVLGTQRHLVVPFPTHLRCLLPVPAYLSFCPFPVPSDGPGTNPIQYIIISKKTIGSFTFVLAFKTIPFVSISCKVLTWSIAYGTHISNTLSIPDRVVVKAERTDLIVEKNQDVTIICTASGQPKPKFSWRKSGEELISNSKKREGKLTLSRVQMWDAGIYSCEATNEINTESVKVKVKIVQIPQFTIKPPEQVEAISCSRIQLDCQGTRSSNLTWQREGSDLPNVICSIQTGHWFS